MAPLDDWKLVDKFELPIFVKTNAFKCNNGKINVTSKIKSLPSEIEGGVKCIISSTNPTSWSGLGLKNPGLYSFQPVKTVGASNIGHGSTMGKTNTALFRILYGHLTNDDIMPNKGKKYIGKSSAGMLYSEEEGKYDYRQKDGLDITQPFSLLIKENGSFEVRNKNNQVWFELSLDGEGDYYVLIGYKFMEFDFTYNPSVKDFYEHKNENVKLEVLKEDVVKKEVNPLENLTGMSLFNQLTLLAQRNQSTNS